MARRASRLPRRSAIVVRRDRRMAQGRCKFVEARFVEIRQGKLTGGAIGLKKYDQRRPARSEPGNRRSGLRRGDHKSDNKFSTRGKVKTKNLETRRERRKNPEDSGVVTRGENCRDTERLFL